MPLDPPSNFDRAAADLADWPGVQLIPLPPGRAIYIPNWLECEAAERLLNELLAVLHWSTPSLKMFGRSVPIPRRHAFVGEIGLRYRWSGLEQVAEPWPDVLLPVRERLTALGLRFNSLLANHYRSGSDSMGWHADDEVELGPSPVIATVSLGQERKLRFRRKGESSGVSIPLEHGSLLLTSGEVQQYWVHQIAKSRTSMIDRVSLTFRYIEWQI